MRRLLKGGALALLASLTLCALPTLAAAERITPSGLPVPRYVTLKFAKVNARSGPGADHRLLWIYTSRGLPVQIVAETVEWRRVCDPQGNLAWVHRRTTDGKQAVLNLAAAPLPMHRKPKDGAGVAAFLSPHGLASLVKCEDGWCRIKAGGVSGWARETAFWGVAARPQCR